MPGNTRRGQVGHAIDAVVADTGIERPAGTEGDAIGNKRRDRRRVPMSVDAWARVLPHPGTVAVDEFANRTDEAGLYRAAGLPYGPRGAPFPHTGELALVRLIAQWPRQVEAAASAHEPHRIAFYLYDLAAAFHAHWTRGREEPGLRFVVEGEDELSRARLALVQGIGFVIGSGLKVFGVTPVEEMR